MKRKPRKMITNLGNSDVGGYIHTNYTNYRVSRCVAAIILLCGNFVLVG